MQEPATLLGFIAVFVSGSVSGTALSAWRTHVEAKYNRRADFLFRQLSELYGPLHFLCGQNATILDLINKISTAVKRELIDVKYARDPGTRQRVKKDLHDSLEVNNKYSEQMSANNHQMVKVITEHCHLIEPDDADAFQSFVLNALRERTEINELKSDVLPDYIYEHLEPLYFFRADFRELNRRRFLEITSELKELHVSPKRQTQWSGLPFRNVE